MNTTTKKSMEAEYAVLNNGEVGRLSTVRLSDVEPEQVQWLWQNRVPLGKLTIKAGMQGLGKSFVTLEMASIITTGRCWPDLPDEKIEIGSVVLLNLEDGLGDTIRPRLDRMGADTNRIVAVEGVHEVDHSGQRVFNIERDTELLQREIEKLGDVRLVIIDPLTAYIGGRVDANRDNEVRAALHPLGELAEQHDVAVVGVMHLRKAPSDQAMFKVLGSTAFTAYPRVVWLIGQDRDNPDHRLMLSAKMNIAKAAPGLRFEIVEPGRLEWLGTTEVTVEEAFTAAPDGPDETGPKVREAMDWLDGLLTKMGPQRAKDIQSQAKENCIAPMTLRRAKERLGVLADNGSVIGEVWFWRKADQTLHDEGKPA